MQIKECDFKGVFEIVLEPREDNRGLFMRVYDEEIFTHYGIHRNWVQENQSMSKEKGTIRGLHFQFPPHAETKLVRVVSGEVFDIVLDLRNQEEIYTGNRFMLYSLYPDQNVSIQVMWGFQRQNIVMACGHSIVNRTCTVDIGSLMLEHGGGGHHRVGTCQVPVDQADEVLETLIGAMNRG